MTMQFDFDNVLVVEYFDDRFYKAFFPPQIAEDYNVPLCLRDSKIDEVGIYFPSVTTVENKVHRKEYIETWKGDVGNVRASEILKEAQDKGKTIHDVLECADKGEFVIYKNIATDSPTDDEIKQAVGDEEVNYVFSQDVMIQIVRYKRFKEIVKPQLIENEKNVYYLDGKRLYAGRLDRVFYIEGGEYKVGRDATKFKGGLYTLDFKTGRNCTADHFAQTSAYTKAYELMTGQKIQGNIICWLNSNTVSGIEGLKLFVLDDPSMIDKWYGEFLRFYDSYMWKYTDPKTDKLKLTPKVYEFPSIIDFSLLNFKKTKKK